LHCSASRGKNESTDEEVDTKTVVHTDGSVENAEEERQDDEGGVPAVSGGDGGNAEVHEDDGLSDGRRQLDDTLDCCLRLDGHVSLTELA